MIHASSRRRARIGLESRDVDIETVLELIYELEYRIYKSENVILDSFYCALGGQETHPITCHEGLGNTFYGQTSCVLSSTGESCEQSLCPFLHSRCVDGEYSSLGCDEIQPSTCQPEASS
jgi:hypothetical protein